MGCLAFAALVLAHTHDDDDARDKRLTFAGAGTQKADRSHPKSVSATADLLPPCWRSTTACRSAVWGIGYLVEAAMIDSRRQRLQHPDIKRGSYTTVSVRFHHPIPPCTSHSQANAAATFPWSHADRRQTAHSGTHGKHIDRDKPNRAPLCKQANGGVPTIRLACTPKAYLVGSILTCFYGKLAQKATLRHRNAVCFRSFTRLRYHGGPQEPCVLRAKHV